MLSVFVSGHVFQWWNTAKLENVAIANALQLEAARCRAVPIRFNFVARAKFELAQPICCCLRAFFLLIRYVTLWPWTLTRDLDLWPWTCAVDRFRYGQTPYKIWAQSSNPRRVSFTAVWIFDRHGLEHVSHVALCSGIVCTKCKLNKAIRSWNVTTFWC